MSDPFRPYGASRVERILSVRARLHDALEAIKRARMDWFDAGLDVAPLAGLEAGIRVVQQLAIDEAALAARESA